MTRQGKAGRLSDADGSFSRLRFVMWRLPRMLFVRLGAGSAVVSLR